MYEANKVEMDMRISELLEKLKDCDPGSEDYHNTMEDLQAMYKLRAEQDRAEGEEHLKEAQLKEARTDRKTKTVLSVGGMAVEVGLFFAGLHFEKTGKICSDFVKKVLPKMKLR